MADRGYRATGGLERLHEIDESRIDPQVIRRIATRNEQSGVVLGPNLVDGLVRANGFLPLVSLQLFAPFGADDVY